MVIFDTTEVIAGTEKEICGMVKAASNVDVAISSGFVGLLRSFIFPERYMLVISL